jgi:Flp pilus assembly protein TadG
MMASGLSRSGAGEKGAALIEFAFILPVLLLLFLGIFEFGMLFQRYEVLTNAVREGARLRSLGDANYQTQDVIDRVNSYLAASGVPGAAAVTVTPETIPTETGGPTIPGVRVTATYTHNYMFLSLLLSSVQLQSSSVMRYEIPPAPSGGGS